jgi:hypothetical protein
MTTGTLKARIIALLVELGPQDDDQIAQRLGVIRQAVNQAARQLALTGTISRAVGPHGKIVNRVVGSGSPSVLEIPDKPPVRGPYVTEDEVKQAIAEHLERDGYRVSVAWGRTRGIDIEAHRDGDRLIIEAKAEVLNPPQQVNYFLNALGELLQRMSDPNARYGLALPDNRQYRGLVNRFPALARARLRLTFFFVKRADGEWSVTQVEPEPAA